MQKNISETIQDIHETNILWYLTRLLKCLKYEGMNKLIWSTTKDDLFSLDLFRT